ncbi:MAG: prolipoprotein diacylglyceryl transferase [Candidatus Izemoplasmatales bacterium]|nr:prolipoprotein diacylglyceryl transferase [Candidatus Izemoplasmatales bacterium]
MKSLQKIILVIMLFGIMGFFYGCDNTGEEPDAFTVSFVDYDGTLLKEIVCNAGEACIITPPQDPNNKENSYFTRWSVWESEYDEINSDTTIKAIYTLDNRVVTIFGRSIVFYSFFIMTGIVVALFLALREIKRHGLKQDDFIDGFLWIVPIAILGSRLWYVAFEWDSFAGGGFGPTILRILGFSSGTFDFSTFGLSGLAIHGAFFMALICVFIYTKIRKFDFWVFLDVMAIGFIIAQAFGRWGNFFNQEAHGYLVGGMTNGVANLTLEEQYNHLRHVIHLPEFIVNNMYIKAGLHGFDVDPLTGFYHPTFFYESMINLVGFAIMLVLRRIRKIHIGEIFGFYLVWYGGLRIFIETMRTDPLTFELFGITFKSAIVTSTLMILGGILVSVFLRIKRKGKDYGTIPGFFRKGDLNVEN